MIPERFYTLVDAGIVHTKIECGDSFRISPDGKTAIVNIKERKNNEHTDRLLAVSTDNKILTVNEARAFIKENKWDEDGY